MSKPDTFDFLTIIATGSQVTTGAASARVAIPNAADGHIAKFVRLQAVSNCYIRCGDVTVVATANDALLSPNEALFLCVNGMTNIAYIQESAATKLNVTPIEAG